MTTDLIAVSLDNPAVEIQDFDRVVELYWLPVFRFVLASLRDRDAAETLAQDCFLKAYRSRERFRGDAAVKTWLMQIAVNLVRDFTGNRRLRFWKRAQTFAVDVRSLTDRLPNQDMSPEARAVASEQIEAIWQATEHLSQRQRSVFLLRFVEEMEIREIAEATGMKEGTVKVHLFRALNAVRERIRRLQ